ncbi:MAG TPA: BatD family protein, partial [Chthoniobacterales bacterium]|nr:BatD family protein [Chthoniobacterales bacterium]
MSAHAVRFHLLVIAVAIAWTGQALADSPTVTAVLSNSEAAIGETVQLQIKISGGRNAEVPDEISMDGLEIHRTGTEQQIEMHNFSMSSSVIYNYTILPLKPGTFRIPSQSIKVAGNSLRTPELTLHVSDTSNGNASRPRSNNSTQQTTDPGRIAFLELVVPKRDAYVGEMIPVEIRLGFAARPVQEPDFGDFNIQGITLHKAEKPEDNVETIKGVKYRVWTVKGAIAAIRPGKLEIPAIEATEVVLLRRSRPTPNPNRNRSPFDVFGSGDPFDDPFFNDPFDSIRGEPTKIPIKSEAVTLDIKPLPPNPPASFSGAVGTFTMNVDVKPKSVQVGDPITVTSTISGRGNFDRMSAPSLEDERGWHKYPPSGKFVQNDDVGISGTKTFEMVISPNEKKSSVPALSFSYFDPLKEKYITLQSDAVPVQVEGSAIVAAQPAATAAGPAAQIGATPKPQDILYQLPDRGPIESFAAIYTRPVFWLAQLVPLAALLGFSGWKIRQGKIGNRETQRLAALQQETAEVERKLRRKDLSPQEYFGAAARAVRLKTALAKNVEPNTVDAELAAKTFDLD